jgi:hypothetical protein
MQKATSRSENLSSEREVAGRRPSRMINVGHSLTSGGCSDRGSLVSGDELAFRPTAYGVLSYEPLAGIQR